MSRSGKRRMNPYPDEPVKQRKNPMGDEKTMKAEDAKKIIATAIDREVEAYTFYRGIADKVKDKTLKDLFAELAGEEKKHREFLQGMLTKDISKMKFDPIA